MENKESVLWEEYISRDTDIYLSQLQLSVLIPALQESITKLEEKIENDNGSFSKEYKQDNLAVLLEIYNILDEEYYAEPTAKLDWEEDYEPDEVDER